MQRTRLAADANTLLSPAIVSTDGARRTTAVLRYRRPLAFPRRTCCAINCRPCPHVFAQEPSLWRCAGDLTAGAVHGVAVTIDGLSVERPVCSTKTNRVEIKTQLLIESFHRLSRFRPSDEKPIGPFAHHSVVLLYTPDVVVLN